MKNTFPVPFRGVPHPVFILLIAGGLLLCRGIAQGGEDPFNNWGLGLLISAQDGAVNGRQNFPDGPTTLYSAPAGEALGQLSMRDGEHGYRYLVLTQKQDGSELQFSRGDFCEVSYEGSCLIYCEEKDGYVRVMPNAFPQGAWINLADMRESGYKLLPWKEFMLIEGSSYYPYAQRAMNIRSGPGVEYDVVGVARSELFEIKPTGESKGNWFRVQILQRDVHPCESGESKIVNGFEGWIKALDDRGYPNIWYPTRGC